MNKERLAQDFRDKGWRVPEPAKWKLKEKRDIKGREHDIYEVNVMDPNKSFAVVEVSVLDDGKKNNEENLIESARPLGWEAKTRPFKDDLRDFLDQEEKKKSVFAISVDNVNLEDEVAEVVVYNIKGKDVETSLYVVRRRDNKFQTRKIINQVNVM